MTLEGERLREWIRRAGLARGFSRVGFAAAVEPKRARERLLHWLDRGYAAGMHWMEREPERRVDPEQILPGSRAVIAVALQYLHDPPDPGASHRISRYAWGDDYHRVLGEKLSGLADDVRKVRKDARLRAACDTSPVMERAWAERAGLGWAGRNTCLIHPELGSWFFLGELFTDLDLPADEPIEDRCGSCRLCLDACPTDAFARPGLLDSSRCIAYLTIEHRGPHPAGWGGRTSPWLAGCDVCQEVCPWNRKAPLSLEPVLAPRKDLVERPLEEWAALEDDEVRSLLRDSALSRVKPRDWKRNVDALLRATPVPPAAGREGGNGA